MTVVFSAIWELFLPESEHIDADLLVLGRAIRQTREQRGMSADKLADATGMDREQVDDLEAGHLDPTYELLLALAEGLGTQPSSLVTLAEQMKRTSVP